MMKPAVKRWIWAEHKGEIWHEITGNIQQEITLDEKGSGEFSVNTRNIAVWIKKN